MIYFYLPEKDIPPFSQLPSEKNIAHYPNLFLSPSLNWTWRTYHHLSSVGYPCKLVTSLPDKGIILSAGCNLPILFYPKPEQFIVSCVADSPPLFFAQCHIFQSSSQASLWRNSGLFPHLAYMPHWSQPGLLARQVERGSNFVNLDYFGSPDQIEPSLKTHETYAKFKKLGVSLRFHFQNFHDYRETDCIFAVRSFTQDVISHKPASKLINAWRAGTPAILGKEAAFREQRFSDLDYIEVNSIDEIFSACKQIKEDPKLFSAMSERGLKRAEEFSNESLTERWISFFDNELPKIHEEWLSLPGRLHKLYYSKQFIYRANLSAKRRIDRLLTGSLI
jgi:hypothetical protein